VPAAEPAIHEISVAAMVNAVPTHIWPNMVSNPD